MNKQVQPSITWHTLQTAGYCLVVCLSERVPAGIAQPNAYPKSLNDKKSDRQVKRKKGSTSLIFNRADFTSLFIWRKRYRAKKTLYICMSSSHRD